MREVEPLGVDMNGQGGALPVVGTAFAMAKGPAGIRSAGGADKATAAAPEALGPRGYGRARGGQVRRAIAWQGLAWGQRTAASKRTLVESE